jgi:sec-independent protein translocase protein TatA
MRFGPLGVWEILIILLVILLVFGPRRLPEMARGLGQSVREFRKGIRDIKDDIAKEEGRPSNVTVASPNTTAPDTHAPSTQVASEAPTQVQRTEPTVVQNDQARANEADTAQPRSS